MWRPSAWIIRRMDSLRAEISLLPNCEGGRSGAVDLGGRYMPHLRVDGGEFLGVVLRSDTAAAVEPGEAASSPSTCSTTLITEHWPPERASRFLKATGGSELGWFFSPSSNGHRQCSQDPLQAPRSVNRLPR